MPNLFLLFSHSLTPEQEHEIEKKLKVGFITPLPTDIQKIWSNIKPKGELDIEPLKEITSWLEDFATMGDFVLIQGEFGATVYLVNFCFDAGLIPIYATTKRVYEEHTNSDGTVERKHIFKHVNFRRYVKWGEKYS
ncbi:MAG TPA: CRISPR-associated protein Csx20 [bacterium]|nr:CRISPR-associated protein Csx20 [bacterium]